MIKRAPEVVPAPDPIMMEVFQAMSPAMIAKEYERIHYIDR